MEERRKIGHRFASSLHAIDRCSAAAGLDRYIHAGHVGASHGSFDVVANAGEKS